MDPKEFGRDALIQIVQGVCDAQHKVGLSAKINPTLAQKMCSSEERGMCSSNQNQ
jgi:hypothetical protein